ncbi:PEX5 [Symbiodinium microadriaticum]|nr:PEX5 [Symbiodinium microadriaticum]
MPLPLGGTHNGHGDLERLWMNQARQPFGRHPQAMEAIVMQQHHHAALLQKQQHHQLDVNARHKPRDYHMEQQHSTHQEAEDAEAVAEEERLQREMEEAWRACLRDGSWEESTPQELFDRAQLQGTRPWSSEHRQRWDDMWLSAHNRAMQGAWSGEPVDTHSLGGVAEEMHSNSESAVRITGDGAVDDTELLTTPVRHPYDFSAAAVSDATVGGQEDEGVDWFARGMDLFEDGYVLEAVRAFERELTGDPENAEAWRMLGACHAENDQDERAIDCLRRALDSDPFNLGALLSLGTSYVNELNPSLALASLKSWVRHNPKFFGLEVAPDEYSDGSLMDEVTQLMMAAAEFDPHDPEVQVVLGVLHNVTQDFGTAVTCFQKALASTPDNYDLLNKIGATLANSNRSMEAISYYEKMLSLRPRYARGWLNVGIAHANSQQYDLAVRAYLKAISLCPTARYVGGDELV